MFELGLCDYCLIVVAPHSNFKVMVYGLGLYAVADCLQLAIVNVRL